MRNMLTIYRHALWIGVVIISTVGALLPWATLYAAPAYEITNLGYQFFPSGINDEGWVAGGSSQAALFAGRLRTIKTAISTARAVNNNGEIVGSFSLPDPNNSGTTTTHAFRHRDTVNGSIAEDLGSVANSNYSEAHGVNSSGHVVGFARVQIPGSSVESEDRVFLYIDKMYDLGTFGGVGAHAYDINDNSDIVGEYKFSNGTSRAFIYSKGVPDYLPPLKDINSVARAINNRNQIVGQYQHSNGETHAFLYNNATLIDLPPLPGDTKSEALDINNLGQVVGYSSIKNGSGTEVKRAFLYDNGEMIDLTLLLPPSTGWTLQTASAINSKGEITGVGTYAVGSYSYVLGYRLSPVRRVSTLEHPKIPLAKTPPNGSSFGKSVAISGDTMVVGAPGESAVYVYRFEISSWVEKKSSLRSFHKVEMVLDLHSHSMERLWLLAHLPVRLVRIRRVAWSYSMCWIHSGNKSPKLCPAMPRQCRRLDQRLLLTRDVWLSGTQIITTILPMSFIGTVLNGLSNQKLQPVTL